MFLILKNSNFSRLFFGRLITNAGDSLYAIASIWLVYDLGGSTFYSGLAGFLVMFPNSLQFLVGPLIDEYDKKKVLIATQIIQAVLITVILLLLIFDGLSIIIMLIIMPIIAFLNQFVYPTQTVLLPDILNDNELVQGNSLFSFAYQGVDLVFNSMAGLIIAAMGVTLIFFIDTFTFLIAALLFANLQLGITTNGGTNNDNKNSSYMAELKEGFNYIFNSIIIKFAIGSFVANAIFGIAVAVLPAYSSIIGGPEYYGLLMGASSGGMLIGAVSANMFKRVPVGKLFILSFFIGGTLWFLSGIIAIPIIKIVLFGVSWVPVGITNVILITSMQKIIPSSLMGRVFSANVSLVNRRYASWITARWNNCF